MADPKDRLRANPLSLMDLTDSMIGGEPEVVEREVVVYQDNPNALVRGEDGNLHFANYTLTHTGIEVSGAIDPDSWTRFGDVLFGLEGVLPIWLGDYLMRSEAEFKIDYPVLAQHFKRDEATLYNYKWVMGSIPSTLRAESLNYNHYKVAAALPSLGERKIWLARAVEQGWSARQLDSEIRRSKSKPSLFKTFDQSAAVIKRAYQNPQSLKGKKLDAAREAVIKLRAWLDEFEQRLGAEE